MGVKQIITVILVLLLSGCFTEKTKPVVEDLTGNVVAPLPNEKPGQNESNPSPNVEETPPGAPENPASDVTAEIPDNVHYVVIEDLRLNPQELTINKGDTVIWDNEDDWEQDEATRHYLYSHTNEFRSPILYKGDTFNHTFNTVGTFTYNDIYYKERDLMRGTIIVK
jgi:plastocyanin